MAMVLRCSSWRSQSLFIAITIAMCGDGDYNRLCVLLTSDDHRFVFFGVAFPVGPMALGVHSLGSSCFFFCRSLLHPEQALEIFNSKQPQWRHSCL